MKFQHLFVAAITVTLLSGCGSMPPLSFSVPNVGVSQKKIVAELKSMTVTIARSDERTGALDFQIAARDPNQIPSSAQAEQMITQLWQTSLAEPINNMAIFQDEAIKKVNLSVKILKLDVGYGGFTKTTTTEARYEIVDRKSGDLIFTQNITSSSAATDSSACMNGFACVREAVNKAVRNNITQFLQALETVDVQKPMFPAKTR